MLQNDHKYALFAAWRTRRKNPDTFSCQAFGPQRGLKMRLTGCRKLRKKSRQPGHGIRFLLQVFVSLILPVLPALEFDRADPR